MEWVNNLGINMWKRRHPDIISSAGKCSQRQKPCQDDNTSASVPCVSTLKTVPSSQRRPCSCRWLCGLSRKQRRQNCHTNISKGSNEIADAELIILDQDPQHQVQETRPGICQNTAENCHDNTHFTLVLYCQPLLVRIPGTVSIKMSSYQYKNTQYKDKKTVLRPYYPYTCKIVFILKWPLIWCLYSNMQHSHTGIFWLTE